MAGHSKWDNIKRKKMKEDSRRAKIFTKISRQIIVAAREGGGDPDMNFRLRLAVEKAKAVNMPNENIMRAIKRGTGGAGDAAYEEIQYEGYGPGGVAILLDIMTDNRNRTAGDLRYLFSKFGGNLGESGCVAWMFEPKGYLVLELTGTVDEDEFLLFAAEVGAEDVRLAEDLVVVITSPQDLEVICKAFAERGFNVSSGAITMLPKSTVEVAEADAKQLLRLLDALEEHDDVQEVYANYEIAEYLLEALQA